MRAEVKTRHERRGEGSKGCKKRKNGGKHDSEMEARTRGIKEQRRKGGMKAESARWPGRAVEGKKGGRGKWH